jgi:hypothetical protein
MSKKKKEMKAGRRDVLKCTPEAFSQRKEKKPSL